MTSSAIRKREIKVQPINIVTLFFSGAILIMINKSFGAKINVDNWLFEKKQTAISCQRNQGSQKENQLPDKNNGCSHIGAPCSLFNISKRNKTHTC